MTTFGTLKATIADQLSRDDLTDPIEREVLRAVQRYSTRQYWFNQVEATLNTAVNDQYYALPGDFLRLDSLKLTFDNSDYILWPRTIAFKHARTELPGQPATYAIYNEQLVLYPVPDAIYPLTMAYTRFLTALSDDADSDAWTTDVEEVIAAATCETLCRGIIGDYQAADQWRRIKLDAERSVHRRTGQATTTGHIQPAGWP